MMQTFLPHSDFAECAACLDTKRLGKQRVEVIQILRTLNNETSGWVNHPIIKAWRGYEAVLAFYGFIICGEWIRRGYSDTCMEKILGYFVIGFGGKYPLAPVPPWMGNEALHSAYRGLLIHKLPEHYKDKLGWDDKPIEKMDYSLFNYGHTTL